MLRSVKKSNNSFLITKSINCMAYIYKIWKLSDKCINKCSVSLSSLPKQGDYRYYHHHQDYHDHCLHYYYFDSLLLDVDECNASSPVCDVNAICNNTIGSYRCACNPGYSGDGRTCKGKRTRYKYCFLDANCRFKVNITHYCKF